MIHTKDPFIETVLTALSFLEGCNTPRSYAVWSAAKQYLLDSYDPMTFAAEVAILGEPVNWYNDISRYMIDYQATVLLSKLPPKQSSSVLADQAIAGFRASEERNKVINSQWLLSDGRYGPITDLNDQELLDNIRQVVRNILGRAPSLQTLMNQGEWTSGASVSISHAKTCLYTKVKEATTITLPLARALFAEQVVYNDAIPALPLTLVPGNKVTTVPKNITTDRTIAMEPDINCFMQRSIGVSISKRLRRFGIDLSDQTLNQRACARAFRDGLATIDLKNASNSVLLMPVMQILPDDWARLVELTRSPYGTLDSRKDVLSHQAEWFEYSMLSSMGNGYTFELESLLFFSVCIACGCDIWDTFVYGDDLIIPQAKVEPVCRMLNYMGLEINWCKSFISGAFFESCGVYFYHNCDVTPFKIKELLHATKDSVILLNKLREFAHLYNRFDGCAKWVLPTWQMCLRRIPDTLRRTLKGPRGSLTVWMNVSEAIPKFSKRKQGLLYGLLVPTLFWHFADDEPLLRTRLLEISGPYKDKYGRDVSSIALGQAVKDKVCGYHSVTAVCSDEWYNWGHWK